MSKSIKNEISQLKGLKVLLVEDDEINQELELEFLVSGGLSVVVANNGQEALELLGEQDFDGVLMDCQMPVMDGYTATRKIREQVRLKELPIIAMTANVMASDREKALKSGMNDFIEKPINVSEMFRIMSKWITHSKPAATVQVHTSEEESHTEELPELPGINLKIGLEYTLGRTDLYIKLLRMFHEKQAMFEEQFNSARSDKDSETAYRMAHSLKGVSGTIGAQAVQKAAYSLEVGCNSGAQNIDELLEALMTELRPVISGLAAHGFSKKE